MNEIVKIENRNAPARVVVQLASDFAEYVFELACRLQQCNRDTAVDIDVAEDLVGWDEFKALAAAVAPLLETATVPEIKKEIAMLLAAFPSKDDLTAFAALTIAEISSERPTRLMLAAACRELRRTSKFRPSIAEILQALRHVERNTSLRLKARLIVGLPRYIGRARQILDERQEGEK